MVKSDKKWFFTGVLAGAIAAPIGLFAAGWIVTSGVADTAAKESAEAAVIASLTPICVSQFPQDASRGDQLAMLKSLSQWDRPEFVSKSGWATMPGGSSADTVVANECARRLADLEK